MTLVEILVASAIFLVASVGVYNLFMSGARTTAVSMWYSKSNIDLRNGLRMVREDLMKASYPSTVADGETVIRRDAQYMLRAADGRTELAGATGGGGTLLSFTMCKPEVNVAGVTSAGSEVSCSLEADGNKLRYRRGGANPVDRVIISDVDYVEITRQPHPDDAEKQLVTIEVGTVHPVYPQSKVAEKTSAKVEVE